MHWNAYSKDLSFYANVIKIICSLVVLPFLSLNMKFCFSLPMAMDRLVENEG